MPSERLGASFLPITGRCYCGDARVFADKAPQTVAYCHCPDCRRSSGAPVAAFAAFGAGDVVFTPELGACASAAPGARRWFCPECGSSLAAAYDYLPGQIYVPLGILDQAEALPPELHCHWDHHLSWGPDQSTLPRESGSGRERLRAQKP